MGIFAIAKSNDSDHLSSLFSRLLDRRCQIRFYSTCEQRYRKNCRFAKQCHSTVVAISAVQWCLGCSHKRADSVYCYRIFCLSDHHSILVALWSRVDLYGWDYRWADEVHTRAASRCASATLSCSCMTSSSSVLNNGIFLLISCSILWNSSTSYLSNIYTRR